MNDFMTHPNAIKGFHVEDQFVEFVKSVRPKATVEPATIKQNRCEHWDFKVNGLKIEVKGIKNCRQEGTNFTILEIFDVYHKMGWLYGDADYICFQSGTTENYCWLFTPLDKLQKFHQSRIIPETVVDLKDAHHKIYTRNGNDRMTVVDMNDLKPFSIIAKIKNK